MIDTSASGEISHGPNTEDVCLDDLPVIKLSTQNVNQASRIARRRSQSYEKIDGGRIYGHQSSYEAHLTGVIGETAVAEFYNTSINTRPSCHGDDGYDLNIHEVTIDVKTTRTSECSYPKLIVSANAKPTADLYYLVHWVGSRVVRISGYASRYRVFDRSPERFPGEDLNYVVPCSELIVPPEEQPPHPAEEILFHEAEML